MRRAESTCLAGIHPVKEALRRHQAGAGGVERVHVARGAASPRLQECITLARELRIPIRFEERASLDRMAPGAVHQGIVAMSSAGRYRDLEEFLTRRAPLIVVLDGIEDPHNLGAVMRTAHAAGASAIVIPERRSAGLTPASLKAAAGAAEHLAVVRVTNVNRALEQLKEAGYWIYGLDERGTADYDTVSYNEPTVIVAGGEGKGMHQQTRAHCDVLVRIPLAGEISSLNVSVAAGIVLFEWKRRRPRYS